MNRVCLHCGYHDCVDIPKDSTKSNSYSFCLSCKVYFMEDRRVATPPQWVKEFAHRISPVPQRIS